MRALTIEFASRVRVGRRIGWGLLVAGIIAAGVAVDEYRDLDAELERWESSWSKLRARSPRRDGDGSAKEKLELEIAAANKILDRLVMPWDDLLKAVERTADSTAVLLGLEPDGERRELRLTAEAKDAAAMLDYLRRLQAEPALAGAHLITHRVQTQDPSKPVQFQVNARWLETHKAEQGVVDP